jgi:hypothetical protein
MTKQFTITIKKRIRVGKTTPFATLKLNAQIVQSDLSEHDVAACLFALEFAANNHSEVAMRVHIEEQHENT